MIPLDPMQLPLTGRRLIEASAGTGKTWTITSILLRLLLQPPGGAAEPLPRRIQDILIVTYTRAATEELRGRIRERLAVARRAFESDIAPEKDELVAALLAASADRATDAARLRLAETELDVASIFTIHGFASRMLNRNAFESGVSFAAEISENDTAVVTELIRDFWRERVYPLPPQCATLLLERCDAAAFERALRDMLGKQGLVLLNAPAESWAELLAEVERAAERVLAWWRTSGADFHTQMQATRLNKGGREALATAVTHLDAAAAHRRTLDHASLKGLSRAFLTTQLNKKVKGNALPEMQLFDLADALLAAGDALQPRLLADAHALLPGRLEALKERTGLLGYDDLLRLLDRGLRAPGGERLAQAIRTQYPVALIDEFQDTDALQWSVFSRVYDVPDTALFLVGDPKQAIYAFRGADVHTYLGVRRTTDPVYSLDTNYRSVAPLIEAVNALFRLRDDPFRAGKDMPFHDVQPSGRPEATPLTRDGAPLEPLAVLHLPGEKPIAGGEYRTRMAAAAANHLAELLGCGRVRLGGRAIEPGDVACLVRDRHDAKRLAAELDRRGIPHVYRSRDSVFGTEAARDLYQLLAAVLEPASERLLRAALGCGLLGYPAAALDRMLGDEAAFAREQQRVLDFADELRLHGVQAALRRALFEHGVAPRLLGRPEGERALTDCLHLIELLQAERDRLDSDEALLARFAACIAGGDGEREVEQLRLESDEERVQIVTLHASKGLEYPVVYLPFTPIHKPARAAFFHDDRTDTHCLDLRAGDESLALADDERLAEDMRLLYVGLTRAAHLCVLGIANVRYGGNRPQGFERSAPGYLVCADTLDAAAAIARLAGVPGATLIDAAALSFAEVRGSRPVPPAPRARCFDAAVERDWQSSSYSALTRHETPRAVQLFRQPELLADEAAGISRERSLFAFPRGARHGSFLHGLLERADFNRSARTPATQEALALALTREGHDAQWLPALTAMLEDVTGCALDGDALRLRELAPAQRVVEMGFEFPLAPLDAPRLNAVLCAHDPLAREAQPLAFASVRGMLGGFIDLVFEYRGRYYVADYKSNHLGDQLADYAPARLRESIIEHRYDLQYALYTVALARLLRARLGADYDYDRHVGGVYYLYLRGIRAAAGPGCGVFHVRPERALIDALDALFGGGARDVA